MVINYFHLSSQCNCISSSSNDQGDVGKESLTIFVVLAPTREKKNQCKLHIGAFSIHTTHFGPDCPFLCYIPHSAAFISSAILQQEDRLELPLLQQN